MKILNTFLIGALLVTANKIQAQDNYSISTYTVTIDGTSNLHNWNENVEKVSGKGVVKWGSGNEFTFHSFNIVMEVNSIKSTEGSTMNNKTYKALKSDKFPQISFLLIDPVNAIPQGASAHTATAKGTLTIAGVTKVVDMPIKISEDANKKITVEGTQKVKMSDYGIKAPTAVLGMLKTGDVITISFKAAFIAN
jgi:hypothetical protein